MEEILFENRNRSYGAYQLRKSGPGVLYLSTGTVLLGFSLAMIIWFVISTLNEVKYSTQFSDDALEHYMEKEFPVILQDLPAPPARPKSLMPKTQSPFLAVSKDTITSDTLSNGSSGGDQGTNGDDKGNTMTPLNDTSSMQDEPVFTHIDEPPAFPGGEELRINFLRKHTMYPRYAKENGIQGTVYMSFIVEPDGKITNIGVLQGIGSGCDQEAYRVVTTMPPWVPGKKNGKAVRVQVTMPMTFTLLPNQ
jgi:protein TonB